MNATSKSNDLMLTEKLAVDTAELMKILSCGRQTAVQIGAAAEARVQIGKRILWNTHKVGLYLDRISTE